jgi:signal transduction histidine kinase
MFAAACSIASLVVNFLCVPATLPAEVLRPVLIAVALSLGGSVVLANITQGRFLWTVRLLAERSRAEKALQRANETLEARVFERTVELEHAYREMESFSYTVSHDLRAPLRSIDGFALVTLEELGVRATPQATEALTRIRRAATRMGRLIDGFLQLGRAGRHRLEFETIDLTREISSIVEELADEEPGRRVEARIARGATAVADPRLMRIVLVNLLGNAWKYTRGRESALVEFGYETTPDGVVYHVKDNGVGFESTRADDLFVPFLRLHSEPDFTGSGVGLATVERILRRHGGRVWAHSAPGQGATFYFTLDARNVSPSHPVPAQRLSA